MFQVDMDRLHQLAYNHSKRCRCPLGSPGCQCTQFKRDAFNRLFDQLVSEMIAKKRLLPEDRATYGSEWK